MPWPSATPFSASIRRKWSTNSKNRGRLDQAASALFLVSAYLPSGQFVSLGGDEPAATITVIVERLLRDALAANGADREFLGSEHDLVPLGFPALVRIVRLPAAAADQLHFERVDVSYNWSPGSNIQLRARHSTRAARRTFSFATRRAIFSLLNVSSGAARRNTSKLSIRCCPT